MVKVGLDRVARVLHRTTGGTQVPPVFSRIRRPISVSCFLRKARLKFLRLFLFSMGNGVTVAQQTLDLLV
jgi:hypothetical protein